jgi:HK97 family phage prohead protease
MTTTLEQRTDVATSDLCRSAPFELVREDGDPGDGRTFRGYAAMFNQPTTIDSWEGRFEEDIAPGAFKRTLRAQTPVLQFDHGSHPLIGSIPLGSVTEAREDDKGVFLEARMSDNWLIQPIRDAIAEGSVNGMSFRFSVIRDKWVDADGTVLRTRDQILNAISRTEGPMPRRTLLEVKAPEMGPVVFPAYAGTSATVRSVTINLTPEMDDEDRKELARAVFAADAATTSSPDSPEGTSPETADHETRDDSPQGTADAPAEHESDVAEPQGLRDAITRWRELKAPTIRHALEGAPRYE